MKSPIICRIFHLANFYTIIKYNNTMQSYFHLANFLCNVLTSASSIVFSLAEKLGYFIKGKKRSSFPHIVIIASHRQMIMWEILLDSH